MQIKKMLKLTLLLFCLNTFSQEKGIIGQTNWLESWTNFKPRTTVYKETNIILSGSIDRDMTLSRRNTYQLVGTVYVKNNATLTIEPGTIIRGDYDSDGTLIITKGSKIFAQGTETDPIVFTSEKGVSDRKSGDWGGIIILGEAPINKFGGSAYLDFNLDPLLCSYGGTKEDSDSGVLKYVRIEFSGRKLNATKELNGLSLAGVGKKTKLEFIQISYSNDDSFECYGGNINFSNIISYRATDDDFDFTQGVQCNITNALAIRYPYFSDVSKSRCFEVDSYDKIENTDFTKKMTNIVANNITLINFEDNNEGLTRESIYIKENTLFNISNSVISGFKPVLVLENKIDFNDKNLKKIQFQNCMMNNCSTSALFENSDKSEELSSYFGNQNNFTEKTNKPITEIFNESDFKKQVDFRLKNGKMAINK
jgi:hypothetical protein